MGILSLVPGGAMCTPGMARVGSALHCWIGCCCSTVIELVLSPVKQACIRKFSFFCALGLHPHHPLPLSPTWGDLHPYARPCASPPWDPLPIFCQPLLTFCSTMAGEPL